MTSATLLCIAASLTLASLVHAKGRSGGSHTSGGTTYGTTDPTMNDLIQIGPWLIAKKWVIIGGVGIGLVVLAIVAFVFIKCGVLRRLKNRKAAAQQKALQQQEAQKMQPANVGAYPTEAWGHTWRPGPQQQYVQIQPAHDHTPSMWSTDSQQKLPYAQGGLGYTAHHSDPSIYHPPTPPAPYSIPYNPPHH